MPEKPLPSMGRGWGGVESGIELSECLTARPPPPPGLPIKGEE
jgi:hypothetical protein